MLMPPAIANIILIVVTAVWVASFAMSLISPATYHPDPQINVIFMGIVGAAWAHAFKKGGQDNK
jgi:hypothetical protein